jgi:hypothetical protein
MAGVQADVPRPTLSGNDPKPQDAAKAILAAFDKYEVVGMGAAHGNQDLDQFILNLIRDPELAGKINDIVVECGQFALPTDPRPLHCGRRCSAGRSATGLAQHNPADVQCVGVL